MRVWLVRGGKHGETETLSLDKGVAAIGFSDVPDVGNVSSREDIADMLKASNGSEPEGRITNRSAQLYTFAHRIELGDLVVMPLKTKAKIAVGEVTGGYKYIPENPEGKHAIEVNWLQQDIPRATFKQDLLYSLGAFMTVCQIKRNNALTRIQTVLAGKPDPGDSELELLTSDDSETDFSETDLEVAIRDQITRFIQSHFSGHDLARLVGFILQADGYNTELSPPGPDGGVDILAGKGFLGLDSPRLLVQVKSGTSPADVTVYRNLQGTMQSYKAELGLLVSWSGFTRPTEIEAKPHYFQIRLWDQSDLLSALFRTYDRLPEELRAELPLSRTWLLVQPDSDAE